jgi:hypothetical protein
MQLLRQPEYCEPKAYEAFRQEHHRVAVLSLPPCSFDIFLRHRRLDQLALPRRCTREVVVWFPSCALTCGHFLCLVKRTG